MQTTTALPALLLALVAIGRSQSSDLELCKNSYNYPEILKYCSAAIDSGKLSEDELAEAFWKRGYWSLSVNPDLAIHDFTELIQRKPNDPDGLRNRANAYKEKGDYAQALRDYNRAIQLRPRNADGMARAVDFSDRGRTYYEMGDSNHAIQDYDRSLSIKPDEDLTLGDRANAYCSKGNYVRAFQDYVEAIRLGGSIEGLVFPPQRGICYYAKGDYGRALQDFVNTWNALDNDVDSRIWTYLARVRLGQRDALAQLREDTAGVDLEPWPGSVVKLYLGEVAAETIVPSTKDRPKRACQVLFHLGQYALLHKRRKEALSWFSKAVEKRFSCLETMVAEVEKRRLSAPATGALRKK